LLIELKEKINLTRSLGDFYFKDNKNLKLHEQSLICFPEVNKFKINQDMEFLLLCSDGLWESADIQKVCDYISERIKLRVKFSIILSEIFDHILPKKNDSHIGTDNMSCILVKLNH